MRPFNYLANAVRAPEIVAILVRWGFEDLLIQLDTPQFLLKNLVRSKMVEMSTFERVRHALEELGPIFVKFGQILSTRPDQLPQPLVSELKKLRSHVEVQPFTKIEPILIKALGGPIDSVFADFDREAVAAGSLGQVYRAKLKSTGEAVAIKVQRADIHKVVAADLEIMSWFARQLDAHIDALKPYDLPALLARAEKALREELDFENEAANAEVFRTLNPDTQHVFTPKVFRQHCSRRVLVTEWVDGVEPGEAELPPELGKTLAMRGGESVFHQIVVTGFFHSDPHGGNMLITPDHRICFLDWGQAGQITRSMRYDLGDLFAGIAACNSEKVIRVAERMAAGTRRFDRRQVEKEVTLLLNRNPEIGPKGTKIGQIGLQMIYAFGSNGIKVPVDYAMLAKAILSVEETAKSLDPDFDIRACARPFLEKLQRERWTPRNVMRQSFWPLIATAQRLQELPSDLQRLLRRLEDEDLTINLHHHGTRNLEHTFNASMNRLTVGIIIAALIIGSSLIITTGVEPLILGYPAIGILGFIASGLLGLYIIVSTLRG